MSRFRLVHLEKLCDLMKIMIEKRKNHIMLPLCLIKNSIECGDEKTLLDKFVCYFENGAYTPYGSVFDIGYTTEQAILRYKRGVVPEYCGGRDANSNGNGSLL